MDTTRLDQWLRDKDQNWENLAWLLGGVYDPVLGWQQGISLLREAVEIARTLEGIKEIRLVFALSEEAENCSSLDLRELRAAIDSKRPPKLVRIAYEEVDEVPPACNRDQLAATGDLGLPPDAVATLTTCEDSHYVRRSLSLVCSLE